MPVHRVKGGWKWGTTGKVYPTLRQAQRQAAAIFARGYREDQTNRAHQRRAALLLRASARAEKRFEREMLRIMAGVHAGFERALERAMSALEHRHDANGFEGFDQIFPRDLLSKLFVYVRRSTVPAFDRMAGTVDKDNAEALALFGIDPTHIPGIEGLLATMREETAKRMQAAARRYAAEVQEVLRAPENRDRPLEDLVEQLRDRRTASESRAAFIGRDTTLKTNAAITQARQTAAGVTEYRWSTSRDERVRPRHAELEGERHAYDDPPVTNDAGDVNNPGEDWQCRCVPLPVIAELEEPAPEGEETAA